MIFLAASYFTLATLSLATIVMLVAIALAEKGASHEMGGEIV